MQIRIGIVDDHRLFVGSLKVLLEANNEFVVVITATNGVDLIAKMTETKYEIDIMLMDVNMPHMNGFQTTEWLKKHYPALKVVALSMKDDEITIVKMVKSGCCSYFVKDIETQELINALIEIHRIGNYNEVANSKRSQSPMLANTTMESVTITQQEITFLQLACTDMTYKDIAAKMKISVQLAENCRKDLFLKLKVGSRERLCLEAVPVGLFSNLFIEDLKKLVDVFQLLAAFDR